MTYDMLSRGPVPVFRVFVLGPDFVRRSYLCISHQGGWFADMMSRMLVDMIKGRIGDIPIAQSAAL